MDPKGKGMVVNDKEKESIFNEPRDDKPTDSGSSHKKRAGKKKRRIKKIIYYDCRCFGSDRTPGVAPQGVFRSRTVSLTVAFRSASLVVLPQAHERMTL
jgi:hypothetical protein